MALAHAARMAMNPSILGKIANFLSPGKLNAIDKVMRFGPDLGFGALAAAQTPGDLSDKAIVFGSVAGGGLLGGLGSAGAVRHFGKGKMSADALQAAMGAADMFGSIGGDMLAYPAGEGITRLKDKLGGGLGETPYERMAREQQDQMRAQMAAELRQQYGLPPAGGADSYLAQLGLA